MVKSILLVLASVSSFSSGAFSGALVLDGTLLPPGGKAAFHIGADAESFAVFPTDFSRLMARQGTDSHDFQRVLEALGSPVLRLASMQRWDWRGEPETIRVLSAVNADQRRSVVGYPYFSARDYYEFCKRANLTTIPMLDVRYFSDQGGRKARRVVDSPQAAACEVVSAYADFIKNGGYKVLFWELGNEEYDARHAVSPEKYVVVARAYIDAVLAVAPASRFGIPINTWRGEWRKWSEAVLEGLKGYEGHIDYAVVHYYDPVDFTDKITDEVVGVLRARGFEKTKLAITEWRHSSNPDGFDQTFQSASLYARFLMFMARHPAIEVACVHAFPLFGGLAEWSDGTYWTSFSDQEPNRRRRDPAGHSRWRILPFGHAQRLISDALGGGAICDYREHSGGLSTYLLRRTTGDFVLVTINEGTRDEHCKVLIRSGSALKVARGAELVCDDPLATPLETERQPWSVRSVEGVGLSAGGEVSYVARGKSVSTIYLD